MAIIITADRLSVLAERVPVIIPWLQIVRAYTVLLVRFK